MKWSPNARGWSAAEGSPYRHSSSAGRKAGLILAAYWLRADRAVHKRLALLATLALADAGFGRSTLTLPGDWVVEHLGVGLLGSLVVGNSLSIAALLAVPLYDRATQTRTRPIVLLAVAWAVGWQVLATVLGLQPFWVSLTTHFVAWLAGH